MNIVKPFTFTAGTKARANEVNDNFDVLYSQVNSNITEIENNAKDIDELTLNKANINGNSTQRFAVADPVSNSDAINKQTMFRYLGNTLDYISGLIISENSGNPNKAILVTPGAAYDSTHSIVLKLDSNTTKTNTTQAANATYYVYIIGNATGSSIDILISTTNVNPTLPSGYTLYRLIGRYTTDSSSNINKIYSNSNSDKVTTFQSFGSNGYCKFSNGLIIQWGRNGGMSKGTQVTVTFPTAFTTTNYSISGCATYSQGAGDKRSSWYGYPNSTSNFILGSRFEEYGNNTIYWIAIGY